jgi:hypothetical protein
MVSRLAAELCPSPNGPSKSRLFKLAIVGHDSDAASDSVTAGGNSRGAAASASASIRALPR